MGTVLEFHGIKVRVIPGDHEPPHVHCACGGCEARYNLATKAWMTCEGFTRSDLAKIEKQILLSMEDCLAEWEKCNGGK